MSRTNIIALLIFGAVLGYFLSFGPETTQKFKTGVYRLLAPFLTGGAGIKKKNTSVRSGVKTLAEIEHEKTTFKNENRKVGPANQGFRQVGGAVKLFASRAQLPRAVGV